MHRSEQLRARGRSRLRAADRSLRSARSLLRRPGFAAAGAWLALAMLCIGGDLSLGAITGFGSRALVAFALVGAAAPATYGIADVDPFTVDPQSLPASHGLLGLVLLGACLAVGSTSFAAIGPPRAALDFAAAIAAATSVAGPLFPGFSLLPQGLFGEVALAAAALAGALAVVAALSLRGQVATLTLVPAVALAIVSPAGLALIMEDALSWFTA